MKSDKLLNVDLHCHSSVSDGVLKPAELARRAFDNGVDIWALTDHDEVSGLDEAARAARDLGLRFIPGVEVTASWAGQTVHIVGLNIDPAAPALTQGLGRIRAERIARSRRMAERLEQAGVPDSFEGALRYAGNPGLLSRTHFARYMVLQGICATMQDAFDRYLGAGKPGFVKVQWAGLVEAVSWITGSGGRAVLAHPGRYPYTETQFGALFDAFKEAGGTGIEVLTGSHKAGQFQKYAGIAKQYGFLASRGSDFHAPAESRVDLGGLPHLPSWLTPVWHDWV